MLTRRKIDRLIARRIRSIVDGPDDSFLKRALRSVKDKIASIVNEFKGMKGPYRKAAYVALKFNKAITVILHLYSLGKMASAAVIVFKLARLIKSKMGAAQELASREKIAEGSFGIDAVDRALSRIPLKVQMIYSVLSGPITKFLEKKLKENNERALMRENATAEAV